ncbi:MAG: hypothetical protein ACOYO1_18830 [Bacteroidales bacterium]
MAASSKSKPFLYVALFGIGYFLFGYARTALTTINLKPILKEIRFKLVDVFTSKLQIDLQMFNGETNAVTFENITADVFFNNINVGVITYNINQTLQPNTYSALNVEVLINNLTAAPNLFQQLKALLTGQTTTANLKIVGKITVNGKRFPLNFESDYTFNKNSSSANAVNFDVSGLRKTKLF